MYVELVRLLLAVGLVVVLPGWLLVNALFPRGRSSLAGVERGYVVVAAGILLVILVGVLLGFLPHSGDGFFQTLGSGFPHVELAMLGVSLLLGYVGLHRGAYPRLAARYPRLLDPDAPVPAQPTSPPLR